MDASRTSPTFTLGLLGFKGAQIVGLRYRTFRQEHEEEECGRNLNAAFLKQEVRVVM